jgi:hypothetical protein
VARFDVACADEGADLAAGRQMEIGGDAFVLPEQRDLVTARADRHAKLSPSIVRACGVAPLALPPSIRRRWGHYAGGLPVVEALQRCWLSV